jgi:hypothetical protein
MMSLARSPAPSALPDSIARSAALLEAAGFAANLARPGGLMAHTPGPVTSAAINPRDPAGAAASRRAADAQAVQAGPPHRDQDRLGRKRLASWRPGNDRAGRSAAPGPLP